VLLFLEVSATLWGMGRTEAERRRARDYALHRLGELQHDDAWLVAVTGLDRQTVKDFLDGKRWPWPAKRGAIENALRLPPGTLDLAARGAVRPPDDEAGDPVEAAVTKSALSRADKAKVLGLYYELLDAQQERGVS
jgi:hypothetical protein